MNQRSLYQRVMLDEAVFCSDFAAADKESGSRAMVHLLLHGKGYSHDVVESIIRGFIAREEFGTTGIGMGVAAPYICALINDTHFGWFLCRAGVDFNAVDGEPVYLLACTVSPRTRPGESLQIGERLSQALRRESFVDTLRQAENDEDMRAAVRDGLLGSGTGATE